MFNLASPLNSASLAVAFVGLSHALDIEPQIVRWSSASYGPNGPWNAVAVSIGTPPQDVDLLPGGSWMTNVIAPSVCSRKTTCDIPQQAGFYTAGNSNTNFEIGQTGFVDNTLMSGTVGALPSLDGTAYWNFDSIRIPFSNGTAGNQYVGELVNFDFLVLTDAEEQLPDGTTYPVQIGKLALGAPEANQSWLHFPPNPRWNGTLLTSYLFEDGATPSNSYGMHIGSAAMRIPGSLVIGGFDSSRALAPVSSQPYVIDHLPISLLDIGIGVESGSSPFNFTSQSGLLAEGNSSIGIATTVLVEATVPYIYLPQSACDAITQYLPVTFDAKLGLYLWNTAALEYQRIISSPSFLSFTFRLDNSVSQNFTIRVPFALLNLTLTEPIVERATQYLPLRPGSGPSGGSYALGRAFMQAAFVGVNWQTGNGRWFLAQAPGPNTPSDTQVTDIGPGDNSITGGTNVWAATWNPVLKALDESTESTGISTSSGNSTASGSGSTEGESTTDKSSSGLSTGAIAGIAVGAGVLVIAAIVGLFFFFRRRKRNTASQQPPMAENNYEYTTPATADPDAVYRERYGSGGYPPRELDSYYAPQKPHQGQVSELNTASDRSNRPVEMAG